MAFPNLDRKVPPCTRGKHYCQDLCPDAFGVPCSPPSDREYDWWTPGHLAGKHYRTLKSAMPAEIALTEKQERYLRWLAGWDDETAEVVASLIKSSVDETLRLLRKPR